MSESLSSSSSAAVAREFSVGKCPSADLVYSNLLYVSAADFSGGGANIKYVVVNNKFVFNICPHVAIAQGEIGPNTQQRQWAALTFSEKVTLQQYDPFRVAAPIFAFSLTFEMATFKRGKLVVGLLDTTSLAKIVHTRFRNQIFTKGQPVLFEFTGENYILTVNAIEAIDQNGLRSLIDGDNIGNGNADGGASEAAVPRVAADIAILVPQTQVLFFKAADAQIKLEGDARRMAMNPLIQPTFRFDQLGIGGLEKEFSAIFRRAFASRTFPPDIVQKLGIQHIKGILLYGPPGTGKTLMARQISKMLNTREPMIVNGPEVLNKFVGQSEENIRKLFAPAEKEYREKGDESELHIIIFDELDAICKQRGSKNDGTGVGDSIVNQLLSKMDGVEQLNNILVIGMTNRLDMIDEALLRPGRLELKLEISLPDEKGRLQIINIHTREMKNNSLLDVDVNLGELAANSKNFSGAEISGLVKSAASFALNRHVKVGGSGVEVTDASKVRVNYDDFKRALCEVQAAFGASEQELGQRMPNGIIKVGATDAILETGALLIKQVSASTRTPLVTVLLHGAAGTGKTALAASIALSSDFPFIKLVSPQSMVGFAESAKAAHIAKVFADAHRSSQSVIVVDDVERLLEWVPLGPRLSNVVLQTLLVLLKTPPPPGRRLMVLATCASRAVLQQLDMAACFHYNVYVPPLSSANDLRKVMNAVDFGDAAAAVAVAAVDGDGDGPMAVPIKQLLMLVETARQDECPGPKLLESLRTHHHQQQQQPRQH